MLNFVTALFKRNQQYNGFTSKPHNSILLNVHEIKKTELNALLF